MSGELDLSFMLFYVYIHLLCLRLCESAKVRKKDRKEDGKVGEAILSTHYSGELLKSS